MRRRRRNSQENDDDNGFKAWGGYMEAKKAKLHEQFNTITVNEVKKLSTIFQGVGIYVNGLTYPNAEVLKDLMAAHGGQYHIYQNSNTTHVIASNLPNVKIKNPGTLPVVKPNWITDSICAEKLLDYRKYLLYTNQSKTQPRLDFSKPSTSKATECEFTTAQSKANDAKSKQTLTAADPRFLEEFYSNSRLHLISTLGAELKQLVKQMREKSNNKFTGRETLMNQYGRTSSFLHGQVIMHIDMDCFFVSVGLRIRPDLKNKPVAVTHARASNTSVNRPGANLAAETALYLERLPEGYVSRLDVIDEHSSMSEIASCSYEARKFGIKNGMFLGSALKLCPELKTIPYDFEDYRKVSSILYATIASYTLDIEAVSCDEMYVDVSQILRETGLTVDEWATHIRNEITKITGCPCSAGFGANKLQARLATKRAKPAGQFYLQSEDIEEFMAEIPVAELPGVGRATVLKLQKLGLNLCSDIQNSSISVLQTELGPKAGEILYEQAKGIDKKPLDFDHERKSVSADVNYGIRFKTQDEALNFLHSLSTEVHNRLTETGMRARCLTLKLLVRAKGAPVETAKFLGCGVCDSINKSTTSGAPISDAATIFKEAKSLYEKINVPCEELRGVGIQLTKLEKIPPLNSAMSKFLKQGSNLQNQNDEKKKYNVQIENKKVTPVINSNKSNNNKQTAVKQRGRGRGRGKGRGTTSGTTRELNNYFKIKNSSTDTHKLKKEEIDVNVLNALPQDVREEIIKEYKLEYVPPNTSSSVCTDTEKSEEKPQTKSIFSRLNYEELKQAIKVWLRSETKPRDFDVEMLGEYFRQLATERKIVVLRNALNFLHRHIARHKCGPWHKAYFSVVNMAQGGMIELYGNTLLVHRNFSCCENCY